MNLMKYISLKNIPLDAYNYLVNGKSPIEWVMDRQILSKDKESGIINDPNDYANETIKNPAYPLELLQKMISELKKKFGPAMKQANESSTTSIQMRKWKLGISLIEF